MRNIAVSLCLVTALCFPAGQAAATNESQAAPISLLIEPGARQAGMGEAGTATADDALAGYYNPAGLAFQGKTKRNVQFMHTNWLPTLADDMYYEYLAYSQYFEGWGNFSFNLMYFDMGDQVYTTSTGENQGTFSSFELMGSVSYGATMTDNFALGLTLKSIYSKLSESGQEAEEGKGVGSTFAVDIGAMYKTPVRGLTLGATIHNLGPKISYIDVSQADPLPLNVIFGVAYVPVETEFNRLLFVADVFKPLVRRQGTPFEALIKGWYDEDDEWEQVDFKVGTEYLYNQFMALRAGYTYDKDGELKSPTFGIGILYDKLDFDIAYYSATDNPMQDSMRFSLGYNF